MAKAKVETKQVNLNPDQLKNRLSFMIDNNKYLQEKGQLPVALGIIGDSGLGKTSIVEQVAHDKDMNYVKINLAQIGEEVSELVGYPIRQFEMCKVLDLGAIVGGEAETECVWVSERVIDSYEKKGYHFTGNTSTGYCPPEWIAKIDPSKGGIFNLDDWTRGSMRTIQAVMEIISRQEYISWRLPKGWTVLLTANPADGEYLVNEIDEAQRSRFISANLIFDKDCWARHAEKVGIDGRCINFLLLNQELVTRECNPRSITTFFNSISSIKVFENSLPDIQELGEGSVGMEFSSMFTTFIQNKLDKLITPEFMLLEKDYEKVKKEMKVCVSDPYRADIAAVLARRILNYSLVLAEKTVPDAVTKRLVSVLKDDVLGSDQKYFVTRALNGALGKGKFQGLFLDKEIGAMVLK